MRQQKQVHKCPECGGALKRTIATVSRIKWWNCLNANCGWRRQVLPK